MRFKTFMEAAEYLDFNFSDAELFKIAAAKNIKDEGGSGITEQPIETIVKWFKEQLSTLFPAGLKNFPKPFFTAYRLVNKPTQAHGNSWFGVPDQYKYAQGGYLYTQWNEDDRDLFLVKAKIPFTDVDILETLWQRINYQDENEIRLKTNKNIEILNIKKIRWGKSSPNINESAKSDIIAYLELTPSALQPIMDKYATATAGYSVKDGKTVGIHKKTREIMGRKLWEDMTYDERRSEVLSAINDDLKAAGKESAGLDAPAKDKVNYYLQRAMDFLDPMSALYKMLLKDMGATITPTGGVKLPKHLIPYIKKG